MRSARLIMVLTAALLCVAAAGLAHQGPGKATMSLIAGQTIEVGQVDVWNNGQQLVGEEDVGSKLNIQIYLGPESLWLIKEVQIYVGPEDGEIPSNKNNPKLGHFPYKKEYSTPVPVHTLNLDLDEDLEFSWGQNHSRTKKIAVHADLVILDEFGEVIREEGAWAFAGADAEVFGGSQWGWWFTYQLTHPMRGQFIDAQVKGHGFITPTHEGVAGDDEKGGFWFFPGEWIDLFIGNATTGFYFGTATVAKKISPLDLYPGADTDDPRVIGVARMLQTLDSHESSGNITIEAGVAACFTGRANYLGFDHTMFGDEAAVEAILLDTVANCRTLNDSELILVSAADAKGNLEAGLNASGIFRKNVSKTEDWGETKQKLEVMPVYLPGMRSNGDPSCCEYSETETDPDTGDYVCVTPGVPYEEWRDADGLECDPRLVEGCEITLIECRDVAKPLLLTYLAKIDIYDDQVNETFLPGRFSWDVYTAISRDDGTTWKRTNVSRMADLSSFDLEATNPDGVEEPFPGTSGSPYLKLDDNYILNVWESKFCRSGNPRYSITTCDDPATPEVEADDPLTPDVNECAMYCSGNPDKGTEVCEPDYPYDDPYYVTDIWGVRGKQRSVNYNEVDDVAELGIGEIPYSCLWAARGVIVTQKELDEGVFASLTIVEDPNNTPDDPDDDIVRAVELGDIVWYKPERITSGRRDAYLPMVGAARGAGFAIAWQEDPEGLRPGKGKGPGEGWSGAISNHKTDIWYTFLPHNDFATIDVNFVPGGPGDDPNGQAQFDDRPGLGRPKAMVPFALPVRVSDNDMVNTNTLKVEPSSDCVTPPDGTEQVCFPLVDQLTGTFVPMNEEEIAIQFCDHPGADPATCCDPENHESDPNCEDLKGLYGNLNGTKRYAYLARTVDDNGDGVPDYQYYVDRGGTLDLCDTSGENSYMDLLPGTTAHERWFGFTNAALDSKLVCVSSDGRLLDGDVFASRPMLKLNPYTKTLSDGSTVKSAWAQLAYEESKGMGHALVAADHDDGDEIIEDSGQDKPIKQDIGKNMMYHSFDFAQPDLVAPGHIVNLPALCGGLYPNYCGDDYTGTNPTCTCTAGEPVPLYFDYWDGVEWMPDTDYFLQYRTEIARRARFIVQTPGKMGAHKTLGAIIFKQGQEGQGRPADVFIRRFIKSGTGNPYKFANMECTTYLDETFTDLPGCPGDGIKGYNCNIWGEASGDRLCGGVFTDPNGGYMRRDHINLTSADIDVAVPVGPLLDDGGTPDDETDDIYSRDKVLLWSQHNHNLGNESYGTTLEQSCEIDACPGMYSNARSHRGFIRGDILVTAYSYSPNWAAGRNGNDRYNFYVRRSFDGGETWTTAPALFNGGGIYFCREWRTDPETQEPPEFEGFDPECVDYCALDDAECVVTGEEIADGAFEPARNISQIGNNKESSGDPRIGTTPPTYPLDGQTVDSNGNLVNLCPQGNCVYVEDNYIDNIFFVAWGTVDNPKSTGSGGVKAEGSPLDLYYTRSEDYGDNYLKLPWNVNPQGNSENWEQGELVWRYDRLAWGDPEQGECQLRATSDGSKVYAIYHQLTPAEEDPNEPVTRWYPWKPSESHLNDLWFRRVIFWPDEVTTPTP